MSGKIYALQGENLTELVQDAYESEDSLQALIAKHPELLAGDQIAPGLPRKWVLVSREIGVSDAQDAAARWSLDLLFLDQDAIPTLVEVKRSSNNQIRREVVGQMLDYAAGAQNWSVERIRQRVEAAASEAPPLDALGIGPEGEEDFWRELGQNLRSGKLRLIFAADEIPQELRSIIEFLNEQMAQTEVLGLEIRRYRSAEGATTLAPTILGNTQAASRAKERDAFVWDEESFLAQAARSAGAEAATLC